MTDAKIVAGDGTGDYNCDGSDDQEVINKALAWAYANPGNRIHLKGGFEYQITNQVYIGSNTILSGDYDAVLKVPDMACGTSSDNCVFPDGKPVITQIAGTYPQNVEFYGFRINGNCQNQYTKLGLAHGKPASTGSGVERLIGFYGISGSTTKIPTNISVHDMVFYDSWGEALVARFCNNVNFSNNVCSNHQHEAFYGVAVRGDKNVISNNKIAGITSDCIRFDNSINGYIFGNYCYSYDGPNNNGAFKFGHQGIQIANNPTSTMVTLKLTTDNMNVYNNEIVGKNLTGIWVNDVLKVSGATPQRVNIYNNYIHTDIAYTNTVSRCAGISVQWGNGLNIYNNTIDGAYCDGILFYGNITSSKVDATIKGNNIINTKKSNPLYTGAPSVVGYGITNMVPSYVNVVAEENYMTGNAVGDYYGCTAKSISESYLPDAMPEKPEPEPEPEPEDETVRIIAACLKSELETVIGGIEKEYKVYIVED